MLKSFRPRLLRTAAAGLIATSILGATGCKSMPFSMPKLAMPSMPKLAKPDMSKLAFWKSENLMPKKGNLPKPPSLSFDPSPVRESLAANASSARQEMDSIRGQIADTKKKLTAPIREPYKFAAKSAVEKLADSNDLDLNSGSSSRSSLPKPELFDSKITKAQRDFQAALASSSKAIENSVGGKMDDFKSASNDFKLPGTVKAAKTNVDQSLMAVNRSLYDAKGKLASAANNTFEKATDKIGGADGGQLSVFEQRLKQVADRGKAAPAEIASAVSKSASNAFGGVAAPKPLLSSAASPKASNASTQVSSEVADLKAQLAQLKAEQQKLIQQQVAANTTSNAPTSNAQTSGQSFAAASSTLPAVRSEAPPAFVAPAAKEFVANLTARPTQVAPAQTSSSSSTQANPSYPQMYPSTAPLRTASSSNHVLSSAPQNVLRGNFSPVASKTPDYQSSPINHAPTAPAATGGTSQPINYPGSSYPSTPYNGYGTPSNNYSASGIATPSRSESNRTAQASFQQNGDSNLVITASTPVEPAQRHVSEVNIPDAVLQGTSNYAPGTVHPLR